MFCSLGKFFTVLITLLLAGISWSATFPHPLLVKPSSAPNLRRMTRESGYIFAGTVTAIERLASSNSVPVMKITFHVNQGIRGTTNGQNLVIHEWAGLWGSGESYRRGDRVLLFLYRPSKLGLTSPVGGWQGRFKLDSDGMVILQRERMFSLLTDPIFLPTSPVPPHMSVVDFAHAVHQAEED